MLPSRPAVGCSMGGAQDCRSPQPHGVWQRIGLSKRDWSLPFGGQRPLHLSDAAPGAAGDTP